MAEKWFAFIYQYGVGGLLFFSSVGFAVKTRALDPASRLDRRLLTILLAGYFGFLALHGIWIASIH